MVIIAFVIAYYYLKMESFLFILLYFILYFGILPRLGIKIPNFSALESYVPELIVYSGLIFAIIEISKKMKFSLNGSIIAIFLFIFINFLVNEISPVNYMNGFRVLFRFWPLFFIAFSIEWNSNKLKKLIKFFMMAAFVQLLFSIFEFVQSGEVGDHVGGTFAWHGNIPMSFLCMVG
ncbi:MAG: hypothetical protein GF317_23710, partial [Candidatus Lokiarchaeota archaeon]|nr:hypothetical protein [Candidatus Lokiarchaeota archaeon]